MQLAGEDASKGKSKAGKLQQAKTYIDHFLLARPDRKAGCGLFTKRDAMVILVGIGGPGITKISFPWDSDHIRCAVYALVERLYDPGPWSDPELEMVYHAGEEPESNFQKRTWAHDPDGGVGKNGRKATG